MSILPGEQDDDGQTTYEDTGHDENACPHDPVEGDDTRAVVVAGLAALGTREAHEHVTVVVLVVLSLRQYI